MTRVAFIDADELARRLPMVTAIDALIASVREGSLAVNVNVPAPSMLQPVKVATPETVVREFEVAHESAASPSAGGVATRVTTLEPAVTTLPPASSTVTTGCVPNATPNTAPLGWVVKANFAPTPTETTIAVLTAWDGRWYDQVAPRVYADAGNITPYLHGAALPGVFGALFGSSLDSSDQAHNNHPLGATISGFAQNHSDPGRLRVSIQRGRLFAAE